MRNWRGKKSDGTTPKNAKIERQLSIMHFQSRLNALIRMHGWCSDGAMAERD